MSYIENRMADVKALIAENEKLLEKYPEHGFSLKMALESFEAHMRELEAKQRNKGV